jgi:glycosyltransferase involved in cell wall biosynthesis
MNKSFKLLPKEKRKNILLITDDYRVHSGVGTVAREIMYKTSHHFNWVQLGGAITHPDIGKIIDISSDLNNNHPESIKDAYGRLYPTNGYGDIETVRAIIKQENIDAIMLITDPRYFLWLFRAEDEIRKTIPITYLNIWDDYPAPMYNSAYYEACDLLMGISKQTVNINKLVLGEKKKNKIFKYIPHGLDHNLYKPLSEDNEELIKIKKEVLGSNDPLDFILFFNSRNIRRKQISDSLLAFRAFLDTLPKEKARKCKMLLHTEIVSDHGTDLGKVVEYFFGENYSDNIIFTKRKFTTSELNCLYNIADTQILITSNEGWGMTLTESILAGTPIIANVTGGMQDQMRFEDENGEWFTPSPEIPSNHRGTYKKHGEWAFPCYPTSRSVQGSPLTPYIFDDRCKWEDATEHIITLYNMSREERKALGLKGREWAISDEAGFTSQHQAYRVIEAFKELFNTWKPREKYEILNANEYKGKFLPHKIYY